MQEYTNTKYYTRILQNASLLKNTQIVKKSQILKNTPKKYKNKRNSLTRQHIEQKNRGK